MEKIKKDIKSIFVLYIFFPIKRCDSQYDAPFAFYCMPLEPDLKRQ